MLISAVLIIGVGIYVGGAWGIFISAVGGSVMPAALVNAWLDPLLREDAAHDMKVLLDVRADLDATGFMAAWRSTAFDIRRFIGRTNSIDVLPLSLRDWMNRDYATLLEICAASAVKVRIYLPAPDEPWCSVLAHRDHLESNAVHDQLIRMPDQLLRAWDASPPHMGSRIEVFFFDGVPSTGITLCDGGAAVEVGPAVRDEEVKVPGHVLAFEFNSAVDNWARRQLSFGGESRPTSAGLRPLPQVQQAPSAEGIHSQPRGTGGQVADSSSPTESVTNDSASFEARDTDGTE